MGSPEIAPFHRLLKDRPEAGLEASAAPSDLLLKSRRTQTCILSQTVWLNGFVITAQTITRDLRGKHWGRDICCYFFLFWVSAVASLIVKDSDQMCQYLGVTSIS